ncbi:hypothetical protein BDF21DRAFT_394618 [Thamnidium elegans]|nr:hypothetical protein BDF21DRAFT_394618 [Thamnidium elegans]
MYHIDLKVTSTSISNPIHEPEEIASNIKVPLVPVARRASCPCVKRRWSSAFQRSASQTHNLKFTTPSYKKDLDIQKKKRVDVNEEIKNPKEIISQKNSRIIELEIGSYILKYNIKQRLDVIEDRLRMTINTDNSKGCQVSVNAKKVSDRTVEFEGSLSSIYFFAQIDEE